MSSGGFLFAGRLPTPLIADKDVGGHAQAGYGPAGGYSPAVTTPARSGANTASGRVFLVGAACNDTQCVVWQGPLQRLRLVPRRAHPDVALFVRRQNYRHGLRVDGLDDRVRRRRQEAVDVVRAGIGFDFVPRSPRNAVQIACLWPLASHRQPPRLRPPEYSASGGCRYPW